MTNPARSAGGVIDLHAHISDADALHEMHDLAPDIVPALTLDSGRWRIRRSTGQEQVLEPGLLDPSIRFADMDRQGIALQAAGPWTSTYLYEAPATVAADLVRIHNNAILRLADKHPDRLLAVAGLPLQDSDAAVAEVERLAATGAVAVQIGTVVGDLDLDHEQFEPVWGALQAIDLPVIVHPYGPGNERNDRLRGYYLSNLIGNPYESTVAMAKLVFSGVNERYPRLRFAFVHGGGFTPFQLGRWDHGFAVRPEPKTRLTRPPSEYARAWYYDDLTHSPESVRLLADRFGWSQVVFGTDYPWDMGVDDPIKVAIAAGADDNALELIGSTNPRRFLRHHVTDPEGIKR